jgi:phosphoenolpyruvate carboxylase
MYTLPKIERFNQNVLSKYNIYSVFITLPFDSIDNTGLYFLCLQMFVKVEKTADSKEIVDYFMNKYSHSTEADKIDIMFRFIQYIERQIIV